MVVERVVHGGDVDEREVAEWLRIARRLAKLEHPNVARVRDVLERKEDVLVASDYLDGVRWSELTSSSHGPGVDVSVRILLDVLAGLGAVHNLRDEKRQPLNLVHGGLTGECVLVGIDGVGSILGMSRVRTSSSSPRRRGRGYLARARRRVQRRGDALRGPERSPALPRSASVGDRHRGPQRTSPPRDGAGRGRVGCPARRRCGACSLCGRR
jgi:serine/threonine-protein kinase